MMNSGSEIMFDSLVRLWGDYLLIGSNQFEQYIDIGLIEGVTTKKETHAIKVGAAVGFVIGAVVGGIIGTSIDAALGGGGMAEEAFLAGALIGGVGSTLVGATIGLIVDAALGKDEIHDMTGWSMAQKRDKIKELMNRKKGKSGEYGNYAILKKEKSGEYGDYAILTLKNGYEGKGYIIYIGEDFIEFEEIFPDGHFERHKVYRNLIFKLISPEGKLIISNGKMLIDNP